MKIIEAAWGRSTTAPRVEKKNRLPALWRRKTAPVIAGVITVALVRALLSIAFTFGVAHAFDSLTKSSATALNSSRAGLIWVASGVALFGLVSFAARFWEQWLSERLGQEFVHSVRMRLVKHLQRLPASSVVGQRKGATILRFIGDLNSLKNWVSNGLVGTTTAALTIVGGIVAMFLLDLELGAIAVCALAVTLGVQGRWKRVVDRRVRLLRKKRSGLATDIVEAVQLLSVVQSSNQSKRERRRLRHKSRAVVESSVATSKASGVLRGLGEIGSIALLGSILIVGSLAIRAGDMSASGLVAALVLSRYLGAPIRRLSRVQEQWLRARVSRDKINQFLAHEALHEPKTSRTLKPGPGRLKVKKVALPCVDRPLSANARGGDRVHLRGDNGVGKSTLMRVLAGLERPRRGMVSLDGRDLARCDLATVRSAICLVSPDLPLMRGSLRRNLTYSNPRAEAEDVERILEATDLTSFVARLDRGLDTPIADGGSSLSAGERQRIQLARALLATPRVLLLDEADAGLDAAGRLAVRRLIDRFSGTVVFVWRGSDAPRADIWWTLSHDLMRSHRIEAIVERGGSTSEVSAQIAGTDRHSQTDSRSLYGPQGSLRAVSSEAAS